jgi:hypothetical protein
VVIAGINRPRRAVLACACRHSAGDIRYARSVHRSRAPIGSYAWTCGPDAPSRASTPDRLINGATPRGDWEPGPLRRDYELRIRVIAAVPVIVRYDGMALELAALRDRAGPFGPAEEA